jgi:hypothetical protein
MMNFEKIKKADIIVDCINDDMTMVPIATLSVFAEEPPADLSGSGRMPGKATCCMR